MSPGSERVRSGNRRVEGKEGRMEGSSDIGEVGRKQAKKGHQGKRNVKRMCFHGNGGKEHLERRFEECDRKSGRMGVEERSLDWELSSH